MIKIFEIYLYICGTIISLSIILGLLVVLLNLVIYAYQTFIGVGTFRKFLRKYHNEMKKEKMVKADVSKAFSKKKESDT